MHMLQKLVNIITSYSKHCVYIFVELLSKAERRFERFVATAAIQVYNRTGFDAWKVKYV